MSSSLIDTECRVLARLLCHPDIFAERRDEIHPDYFTDERKELFGILSDHFKDKDPDHTDFTQKLSPECKKLYTDCCLLTADSESMSEDIDTLRKREQKKYPVICLTDVKEREPEWLINGYIPKGEITVLAGDGGVGKTFVWCAIAAAISSGQRAFVLNNLYDKKTEREPQKVLYFSTEDSNSAVLCPRLRCSGAILKNVGTVDCTDKDFQNIKFDSEYLERLIDSYRPALVVFDPLQSFISSTIRMAERNQMRNAMSKLHTYGKKYGATFLIIMHTNKQQGVWGRARIADSADIWDIARSVLICGEADRESHLKYLSQEKSSYGRLSQTVLFKIESNTAKYVAYTEKRDREYVLAANKNASGAPEREAAEQFILEYLKKRNGKAITSELDDAAKAMSISQKTLSRAKTELIKNGKIEPQQEGFGKDKIWYTFLLHATDGRESEEI